MSLDYSKETTDYNNIILRVEVLHSLDTITIKKTKYIDGERDIISAHSMIIDKSTWETIIRHEFYHD